MAHNPTPQHRLHDILKGMREVAKITFNKNAEITTDFQAQTPEDSNTPDETPTDDKIPLRKISGNNEIIVAPEYIQEMTEFFQHHSLLDMYTAPCFFNNDACDMTLYVFPRVMYPLAEQPLVKDIIAVTIQYNGTIVAVAEYNTMDERAANRFQKDIEELTPQYYRSNTQQHSLRDALQAKFPGLVDYNFGLGNNEPPVFLDEDRKELPHAL